MRGLAADLFSHMKRYSLHYNSQCADCTRLAELNRRLDWFGRFERTTTPSALGLPAVGDIHVVDHQTGKAFSGAYATRLVCENIPAHWGAALLMKIPFVFQFIARKKRGCNGESCAIR